MKNTSKWIFLSVLLVLGLLLGSFGCKTAQTPPASPASPVPVPAPAPTPRAESAKTVTVAAIGPLEGPVAAFFTMVERELRLGVYIMNEVEGGFNVGGQKYKWDLKVYNHKSDPALALTLAKRAVYQDKARLVMPYQAITVAATQTVTEPEKVLTFGWFWGGTSVTSPEKKYTFRTYPEGYVANLALLPYFKENYKIKTIASLALDNSMGREASDGIPEIIKQFNLDVKSVASEYFPANTIDFSPIASKLMTYNVDMIQMAATGSAFQTGQAIKALRQLGYKGLFSVIGVEQPAAMVEATGKDMAEGVIVGGIFGEGTWPGGDYHKKYYEELFGSSPGEGNLLLNHFDALFIARDGMVKAGSVDDSDKIAAALRSGMTFNTMWGPGAYFGGKAHLGIDSQLIVPIPVSVIKGGKLSTDKILPAPKL